MFNCLWKKKPNSPSTKSTSPTSRRISRFSTHRPAPLDTAHDNSNNKPDDIITPSFSFTSWDQLAILRNSKYPDFIEKLTNYDKNFLSTQWNNMLGYARNPTTLALMATPPTAKEQGTLNQFTTVLLACAMSDIENYRQNKLGISVATTSDKQEISWLPEDSGSGGNQNSIYLEFVTQFTRGNHKDEGTEKFAELNMDAILTNIEKAFPKKAEQKKEKEGQHNLEIQTVLKEIMTLYIESILPGLISDAVSYKGKSQDIIQRRRTELESEKEVSTCCCFPGIKKFFQQKSPTLTKIDPTTPKDDGTGPVPVLIKSRNQPC